MLPEFPALGTNKVHGEQRKCPAGAERFFLDGHRVSLHQPVRMVASMGTTPTKSDAPA